MGRNSGIPCEEIYKEEWRDIKDWAGYQVSDLGRVRHRDNGEWWLINQSSQGYHKKYVVLSHGVHWTVMVDRLVMEAFAGARRGRRIIHLDHNTHNNALDNMQYANKKEYEQWFREHWGAIGRTKEVERLAAATKRRQEHHQRNNEAARKWLSGELTLKEAAKTIDRTESALSYWVKRHGLREEFGKLQA